MFARLCLLFQLTTVYPLILYIIRVQFFGYISSKPYPGLSKVFMLNIVIVTITTLINLYYPNVGDIQRYTGAICGFSIIFFLPTGIYINKIYPEFFNFNGIGAKVNTLLIQPNQQHNIRKSLQIIPKKGWKKYIDIALHIALVLFGSYIIAYQFV